MDENSIFKNPSEVVKEPIPSENNPIVPPQSSVTPPPVPPPAPPSTPPYQPEEIREGSSIFSKIFKIILGFAFVSVIGYVAANFILPRFFPPSEENKVMLTYWGIWEEGEQIQPVIEEFEKQNPNIKVEYAKQNINEYKERLVTRSNNGNGPDIFSFHNTWVPMLSDLLLPLPSDVISKEDFAANYYPVIQTDLIRDGAIYGMPVQIDTLNLFINKDLFDAAGLNPPTTWIEFSNYSRQLTVKDESGKIITSGAAMGTFANVDNAPEIVSMLFVQNGVNLREISSTQEAASDALSFYTSFALPPYNVWDKTLDQSVRMFANGSLAMYFGYSWDYFAIKSINPNLSFEIYPVPHLPDQNKTIASYWAEGVLSKSRHQKEALAFIKHLTSKESLQKLYAEEAKVRNFGEPYPRIDMAESLSNSVVYPFVKSASFAVSTYFADGTFDNGLNANANFHLETAVNSILAGESPQSAAAALSEGVSQVLTEYGL